MARRTCRRAPACFPFQCECDMEQISGICVFIRGQAGSASPDFVTWPFCCMLCSQAPAEPCQRAWNGRALIIIICLAASARDASCHEQFSLLNRSTDIFPSAVRLHQLCAASHIYCMSSASTCGDARQRKATWRRWTRCAACSSRSASPARRCPGGACAAARPRPSARRVHFHVLCLLT